MRKLICKCCGKEFTTAGKNVKYCSGSCAEAMKAYQTMLRNIDRPRKTVRKYGQQLTGTGERR